MGAYSRQRALERVAAAATQGLDLVAFWHEAADAIRPAVPHRLAPCWFTLDPASLLATSHYDHGVIPELPGAWLANEYGEEDVHKLSDVARSGSGLSTVHEATGGDPSVSPRWRRFIAPYGSDQEIHVALRTAAGETWGVLALYRAPGEPEFDAEERQLLSAAAPHLAEGAKRALLTGTAREPDSPGGPGLVVLDEHWNVESLTPGAGGWLDELSGGAWATGQRLPPAVLAVAGRALRDHPGEVADARVLSDAGRWLVLHGAAMIADGRRRAAVIIEAAHPARISPLLMSAYDLTPREREITQLVLRGGSTTDIAAALAISGHTVQQHLKHVFEKTGVRSRRDLLGKIFFAHYEPRLRDNEQRAATGRSLRGGPAVTDAGS
jgi:DNA-binding CsgD family transcriptional regulator